MPKRVKAVVQALGIAEEPETVRFEFVGETGVHVFLDVPLTELPSLAQLSAQAYKIRTSGRGEFPEPPPVRVWRWELGKNSAGEIGVRFKPPHGGWFTFRLEPGMARELAAGLQELVGAETRPADEVN